MLFHPSWNTKCKVPDVRYSKSYFTTFENVRHITLITVGKISNPIQLAFTTDRYRPTPIDPANTECWCLALLVADNTQPHWSTRLSSCQTYSQSLLILLTSVVSSLVLVRKLQLLWRAILPMLTSSQHLHLAIPDILAYCPHTDSGGSSS